MAEQEQSQTRTRLVYTSMNPSVHVAASPSRDGAFEAVKGVDCEIFPGEYSGCPAERRRQDDDGRDPRRSSAAQQRRSLGARVRSRPRNAAGQSG